MFTFVEQTTPHRNIMATITLRLSGKTTPNESETNKAEVLIRFRHGEIDLYTGSGISVDIDRWNKEEQTINIPKVSNKRSIENKEEVNLREELQSIESKIIKIKSIASQFQTARTKGVLIDKSWLDSEIDKINNPDKYDPEKIIKRAEEERLRKLEEQKQANSLFRYIENFIDKAPKRKHRETGCLLSPNNIQQYRATYKHLQAFAESNRKKDFIFADITQKFYDKFVTYLQGLGFTQNSVGKHIRVLKLMLNEAPRELREQANYEKFHVFTEETDTIHLNEAELQQLKDVNFGDAQYLDRVRDWFLLLAWTGSRFSDLEKIGKTDIKDGFISFRQQKTNTKVVIPLHPVVVEVLEKYDYQMPEPISNQRFNEYIKEACKAALIDSTESVTVTVGGVKQTTTQPKHELVSSHTGRRSFATNMYERGLPSLMIMAITGHKTEKSFLKYIKTTPQKHAEMMKKQWDKIYGK